ncbi:hypothetical protein LOTGIDRAFT_169416 [Lottia gigantea]|uniref:Fibrinogen C-terminal domain-containing protein n=1 Tax=Lottia gigantea TaxID=225164 RepID=V3ZGT8_LOTGI|nr:hypothetical protein LOTGIDRAFT_169416 [Lottia gigantea]ESO83352.1 hypothetical protein LOTGIDRAFT_169416 [Lottia gigantea]
MRLGLLCLVLVLCVASTQVDAFRLRNFGTGFRKIIRDGVRFLFGRRDRHQPKIEGQVQADEPVKPGMLPKVPVKESPMKRTIIAIKQETQYGEYLYLRGGGPEGKKISIKHRIAPEDQDSFYASTSKGDNYLDWGSNEIGQGVYDGRIVPQGTPMMWTTNDEEYESTVGKDGAGYYKLNVQAGHYWLVDLDMNCSQTTDGWFEFKGYLTSNGQLPIRNGWERNFQKSKCNSKNGKITFDKADPVANNHIGRCGEFNLVHFEDSTCFIHSLEDIEQWAEDFHGDNPTVQD